MDWANIPSIFATVLNILLAILIWLRNPKNKINIFFSLASFCLGAWAFWVILFKAANTEEAAILFIQLANLFGILVTILFFIFTIYFPYQKRRLSLLSKLFFLIFSLLILWIVIFYKGAIAEVILLPNNNLGVVNPYLWTVYAVYFISIMCWSLINLFLKYRFAGGFIKTQLGSIIIGTSVAIGIGIIFDIILPFWDSFNLMRVGSYSTVSIVIFTSYLVFLYPLKVVKE